MKKILIILGSVFLIAIVLGVIGVSILAVKGSALDMESQAYVDEFTPKILKDLRKETLFEYASDELKNSGSQEEFDRIFKWFAKLGKFKEYKGSTGYANIFYTTGRGKEITGIYQAHAEFENGPATINITIKKNGDTWQFLGFKINSKALIND